MIDAQNIPLVATQNQWTADLNARIRDFRGMEARLETLRLRRQLDRLLAYARATRKPKRKGPRMTTAPVSCPHCNAANIVEWWCAGYHEFTSKCERCKGHFLVKIRLSGHVIPAQEITQERIFV